MTQKLFTLIFIICLDLLPIWGSTQVAGQNGFGGIGLQITTKDNQLVVVSALPNSPAEKAGIKAGDIITQVNGETVANKKLDEVLTKIRGQEGTSVTLQVTRNGSDNTSEDLDFNIIREFILATGPSSSTTAPVPTPAITRDIETSHPGSIILYITPLTLQITPGTPFVLQMMLENSKGVMADDMALWIHYNPSALILHQKKQGYYFELDNQMISGWAIQSTFARTSTGDFFIRFKNKRPTEPLSGALGKLEFEATGKIPLSMVQYKFNEWGRFPNTVVLSDKKDLLGSPTDHKDGTICATIRIHQPQDNPTPSPSENQ